MSHINNQIRDRIATIIGALPFFSGRIYKMRSYALDDEKLPAAVIYTNSQRSSLATIGTKTSMGLLQVYVEIFIKGSSSTIINQIDDACVLIEDAIGSDFQLSGLVKSCILSQSDVDINVEGEKPVANARLSYAVQYVTLLADLETPR
jgi:hypothetical protein